MSDEKVDLGEKLSKGEIIGLLVFAVGALACFAGALGAAFLFMFPGAVIAARASAKKKEQKPGFVMTVLGPLIASLIVMFGIAQVTGGSAGTPARSNARSTRAAPPADEPEHRVAEAEPAARAAEAEPAPAAFKVGDKVTLEDSVWTVLAVKNGGKKLRSNNEFQEAATTEGRFVLVQFKVRNLTNKEERILDQPKLVDAQGREFRHIDMEAFYVPGNAKTLGLEALPSSMDRTFWTVFEVPEDSTGLRFQARTLSAFGDHVLVDLGQ